MQKGRIKNLLQKNVNKYKKTVFGFYGIVALEKGEVTPNQIESVRKVLVKEIKKFGKIWVRIYSNLIRTTKPAEVRMGKGKGSFDHWSCQIRAGQVLFEISNVKTGLGFYLLKKASKKLSIQTKIVRYS